MRSISWFLVILFAAIVIWFVAVVPYASTNAKRGFNAYQDSIPISGTVEERRINYEGEWTVFPPFAQINNLRIQGPRAEDKSGVMYFEPDITMEFVRFNAVKLMRDIEPEIVSIGHVDFEAKVHFISLSELLEQRNSNFTAIHMRKLPDDYFEISGRLTDVNSEVIITGNVKVNESGEVEFVPVEVIDFLMERVTDTRKRDKVLKALDLKWRFEFMGVKLKVNKAAIGDFGIYIEAESLGWTKDDEIEDITDTD
jgi:hypothetical protein